MLKYKEEVILWKLESLPLSKTWSGFKPPFFYFQKNFRKNLRLFLLKIHIFWPKILFMNKFKEIRIGLSQKILILIIGLLFVSNNFVGLVTNRIVEKLLATTVKINLQVFLMMLQIRLNQLITKNSIFFVLLQT